MEVSKVKDKKSDKTIEKKDENYRLDMTMIESELRNPEIMPDNEEDEDNDIKIQIVTRKLKP